MWNIRSGSPEPDTFEKCSAGELKGTKREGLLFEYRARGEAGNVLSSRAVFIPGMLAIVILSVAPLTAQVKDDHNGRVSLPANKAREDDSLHSIYPKLTPNQNPAAAARGRQL